VLSDLATWESDASLLGGRTITVAAVKAWALVDDVPAIVGDGPGVQVMTTTAIVHRERLPATPLGAAVVIGGVSYRVIELGERSDGVSRELMLRRS
jgi:hypothetical protein